MDNDSIPIYNWSDVDIISFLGKGSYGVVYKVQNKITKQIFARKVFMNTFNQNQNQIPTDFSSEVNILTKLHHPTLLTLYSWKSPYIDIPYIENGSLDYYINLAYNNQPSSEWNDTRKFIVILGVTLGLQYLHSNKI